MHALKAQPAFCGPINWRRLLDLSWALTGNFALWALILQVPSVFGSLS